VKHCVLSWIKLALERLELKLLYRDCDLIDENIMVMNKYLEVYEATVRSVAYKAEQTVCQLVFTR
jgi:hypothetical protein